MKKFFILTCILAALGVPWANATVEVRIINLNSTGTAAVGDTGWITCAGSNCSFVGAVGNYDLTSDITVQHLASNPLLDMSYSASNQTNSNPGTIIIEAMADGYNLTSPQFQLIDAGNTGFTDTVTEAAYGGNNNNICAAGTTACWNGVSNPAPSGTGSALIASNGPFTPSLIGGSWVVAATGAGNTVTPYSLGLVFTLSNPTGISTVSGDMKLNAVPEPASIMLLGGVLLFTVGGLRRKLGRSAQ
jgi:hypothetical protein